MNTITIEATRKNGSNGNGDQYVSDTPDGYALSSVQTVSNSASYLLVLHTYTKKVTSDSNPSEADSARRGACRPSLRRGRIATAVLDL